MLAKKRKLKVTQRPPRALSQLVTEWPRLLRGALGHYRYRVELYDYPNSEDNHDDRDPSH
jgi:hypothetical protein